MGGNDPYNFGPGSYFTAVFVPWLSHTKSRLELLTEKLEKLYQLVISTTLPISPTWRTTSSFLDPAQEGIRECFVNPKKISEKDIIQRVTAFQNQCSGTRSRGSCAFRTKPATDRYRSAELLLRDREVRQGRHPEFNRERTRIKISHVPDPAKVRNLPQPFSLRSGRSTRFAPDHLLPPMRRWLRRHSETEPNDSR